MALGRKWYGKIPAFLFGRGTWDKQDAQQAWTDGGSVDKIMGEAATAVKQIVSQNAVLAVSDFASTATAAIRADTGGEVILGIRLESEQAHQILEVPIRALFINALGDMRPNLGLDPEAQAAFSALINIAQQIAALAPRAQASSAASVPTGHVTIPNVVRDMAKERGIRPPGRVVHGAQLPPQPPAFPGPVMG